MAFEDILMPLQKIDGYLASVIVDVSGEVLVQDNISKYDTQQIVNNLGLIMDATLKVAKDADLGACQFVQINSELGILAAAWTIKSKTVASVLLEPKGNIGMGKLALIKVALAAKKEHLQSLFHT